MTAKIVQPDSFRWRSGATQANLVKTSTMTGAYPVSSKDKKRRNRRHAWRQLLRDWRRAFELSARCWQLLPRCRHSVSRFWIEHQNRQRLAPFCAAGLPRATGAINLYKLNPLRRRSGWQYESGYLRGKWANWASRHFDQHLFRPNQPWRPTSSELLVNGLIQPGNGEWICVTEQPAHRQQLCDELGFWSALQPWPSVLPLIWMTATICVRRTGYAEATGVKAKVELVEVQLAMETNDNDDGVLDTGSGCRKPGKEMNFKVPITFSRDGNRLRTAG